MEMYFPGFLLVAMAFFVCSLFHWEINDIRFLLTKNFSPCSILHCTCKFINKVRHLTHLTSTTRQSNSLLTRVAGQRLNRVNEIGWPELLTRQATQSALNAFSSERENTSVLPSTYSLFSNRKLV